MGTGACDLVNGKTQSSSSRSLYSSKTHDRLFPILLTRRFSDRNFSKVHHQRFINHIPLRNKPGTSRS